MFLLSTYNVEWLRQIKDPDWLTLSWHHLYSRLLLHVLVSLYFCLNGLCLRCDWQRSEKFNLTNLSHCCGCFHCASRLPCKDRHGQMRAPQTCTDCPRPFATRKRTRARRPHSKLSMAWCCPLVSPRVSREFLWASKNFTTKWVGEFSHSFQKKTIATSGVWVWVAILSPSVFSQDSRSEDGCFKGLRVDRLQKNPIWDGNKMTENVGLKFRLRIWNRQHSTPD